MSLFVQKLISSIVEIIVFTLVPFIWWLIRYRKECGFFEWIGLKIPTRVKENHLIWTMAGVTVPFMVLSTYMLFAFKNVEMATSEFAGLGIKAVPAILVYAILNTSLPEEILFRGFILKRLSKQSGFISGNTMQAIFFGIIHGAMFFNHIGAIKAGIITVFTGVIGWLMGFINEKRADGSIIPSWCIHALVNIFSGVCAAFLL